jgi:hypothetical protein
MTSPFYNAGIQTAPGADPAFPWRLLIFWILGEFWRTEIYKKLIKSIIWRRIMRQEKNLEIWKNILGDSNRALDGLWEGGSRRISFHI